MSKDLKHYQKPEGWIEFWIGLIMLVFSTIFFGNIAYKEHQVRMLDKKIKQEVNSPEELKSQ